MSSLLEKTRDLSKQLSKAAANSQLDDMIVLLKQLKEVVEPSEELIRVRVFFLILTTQTTKIGVTVGKLRTHSDNRVSELAKELVKSWKTQIEKQRREATSMDKSKKEAQPADTKPSTTTPSTKSIDINFEVLNDKVRNACLKLLYSSLELQEDAEPKTVFASAMEIEQAVYVKIGGSSINNDYRSKVRSLSLNLKDKNNPELRQKVLKGEIPAETLVVMRSEELASKVLKEQHEALRQQNLHNAKGAEAQEAETDAFQCGKCKQKKTRYYQMQTRSADEPMTTFVTCVNCNHKWKFS